MRNFFALAAASIAVSAATNEVSVNTLTIGTNRYEKVTITKKNAAAAVIRYAGGVRKVKIVELPEPLKTEWLDAESARKFEEDRERAVKESERLLKEVEANKNADFVEATFFMVEGRLVPKNQREYVRGEVIQATKEGVLIRTVNYVPNYGRRYGLPGSAGAGREVNSYNKVFGKHMFVRNAPAKPTGATVEFQAFDLGKTIQRGGTTAELYDCGTRPGVLKPSKQ